MHRFLASKLKADWASGLQDLRRVQRRTNEAQQAFQRSNMAGGAMNGTMATGTTADPDAVIVDSPTTYHNHYHPRAAGSGSALLAIGFAILAAALAGGLLYLVLRSPAKVVEPVPTPAPVVAPTPAPAPIAPAPVPVPASSPGYDVSIYEP